MRLAMRRPAARGAVLRDDGRPLGGTRVGKARRPQRGTGVAMSVTVKIFTKHAGRPTLFQTREFDALPVTIGRDATCTLALDDPHKHISRVHVELEEEDGTYWMSVVSKVN